MIFVAISTLLFALRAYVYKKKKKKNIKTFTVILVRCLGETEVLTFSSLTEDYSFALQTAVLWILPPPHHRDCAQNGHSQDPIIGLPGHFCVLVFLDLSAAVLSHTDLCAHVHSGSPSGTCLIYGNPVHFSYCPHLFLPTCFWAFISFFIVWTSDCQSWRWSFLLPTIPSSY